MFEIGQEYERTQLLTFVGSKELQRGIIWGPEQPGCVIATSGGKHSKSAGYNDQRNPDGSWVYFGQGAKGDQDPQRYANKLFIDGKHSILLFITREPTSSEVRQRGNRSKRYIFEGMFVVQAWEIHIPIAGHRAGNKLLLFHLLPANRMYSFQLDTSRDNEDETAAVELGTSYIELRAYLYDRDGQPRIGSVDAGEYKRATAQIKRYARLRANGFCEYCDRPAPFIDKSGQPFFEVHHIYRLADDGPDSPVNVAALCPNCHREAHFGCDRDHFRERITQRVLLKEHNFDYALSASS